MVKKWSNVVAYIKLLANCGPIILMWLSLGQPVSTFNDGLEKIDVKLEVLIVFVEVVSQH